MHRRSFLKFLGLTGAVAAIPKGQEFWNPKKSSMKLEGREMTGSMTGATACTVMAGDSWGLPARGTFSKVGHHRVWDPVEKRYI